MKSEEIYDLSIIIPHYNTPQLLGKLIESIPNMDDIQVIVVDDNSNKQLDVLGTVLEKYENRIEIYINDKQKKGAGTCRNIGLEHAKGKWLLFADADDFFLDGMYEQVKKYFNTEYDIVFFSPISINLDDNMQSHRHEIYHQTIINYIDNPSKKHLLELKSNPGNPPWSKLIRHEMVRKNNIKFEEVLYSNDIMFSAKIGFYSNRIEALQESIYCVTRSKGSLTTYKDVDVFNIRLEEYIKVCCFLKSKYSKEEFRYIHVTGIGTLYRAIREKYGMKEYLFIINKFIKNRIPIITFETFKGKYFIEKIRMTEREKKLDENYVIK